jgi:hypothetical protein
MLRKHKQPLVKFSLDIKVIVDYVYVRYITRHVRTLGLARVLVHFELYTSHTRMLFYYTRESVLVQT